MNTRTPLIGVFCGFEKSGTTVLNEVLRGHPDVFSGHEIGVLLADTPRDFPKIQPYFNFFCKTWELEKEVAMCCCDVLGWMEFYSRLRSVSPLVEKQNASIFDKTPRYMIDLDNVLNKVPGLPCVVNVRDPRALMHSWACWSGGAEAPGDWVDENFEYCIERFASYASSFWAAYTSRKHRIYVNQFEQMCQRPEVELKKIFDFLELDFSPNFLNFDSKYFVYGNKITEDYVRSYQRAFSSDLCARIIDATKDFGDWHFE